MERTDTGDTKRRLLDAAGAVISEKGFRAATVREICRLAKANVAAVHYHFGDKEGLYKALLEEAFEAGLRRFPADMGLPADSPAEERLHAFVHSFLLRTLSSERFAWCGKLMSREVQEPTPALDHVVERYIMPMAERLRGIVAELLGQGARPDDPRSLSCTMSVIGQCQFLFRARPLVDRLAPGLRFDEAGIDAMARHISDFSLSALRNMPPAA
jgi:TetR/AcrR family transcriptional regulator, regulator of cefoperazone and chloramphenicol sensitivity